MGRLVQGKTYYTKPWYNSWRCMMSRCYRPKDASFKNYGGKGITVCDEWHNIENFEKWIVTHPYFEGATIDRIDTNGNYTPENCRWATMFEQCKNRRNSILIEFNGETHNITEWSQITGINRSTLNNRYWRGERSPEIFRQRETHKSETWIVNKEGKREWVDTI